MDACKECIAYKIHHNQAEPWECPDCGKETMIWKQHSSGIFYVECSNCGSLAAVDLNTPCEQDQLFMQKTEIIVDPQVEEPSNRTILDLAKHFHVNGIQMREKLMKGFSFESGIVNIDEYAELFKHFDITYRIVDPIDPRTKYHYYKKCKYPYSSMSVYLK